MPAPAEEHQGVYGIAREDGRQRPDALRGLWVESGFPSENATTQKCWSGFCFETDLEIKN
jgi:hypothetical protein